MTANLLTFPSTFEPTGFYTASEASRIARVPRGRIYAWRREGILLPTISLIEDGRETTGYTFQALVYMRLLRMLRDQGVALIDAVGVIKHLRDRFGPPGASWQDARIFLDGGHVYADRQDPWEVTDSSVGGQRIAPTLMGDDFARLRDRADALLIPQRYEAHVEIDPLARSGRPIVRGSTIETGVLHRLRQRGLSNSRIRQMYPHLSPEQIRGAIAFERYLDAEAA